MPGIIVQPDKSYNIMEIAERFEVPGELVEQINRANPAFQEFLVKTYLWKTAYEVARNAAAKYERLRGWHWRPDLGVTLDKSELQVDVRDLGMIGGVLNTQDHGDLLNRSRLGNVAYVLKMKFIAPEVRVYTPSPEELNEDDGFVETDPRTLPREEYIPYDKRTH